jgi:hypothetical protein
VSWGWRIATRGRTGGCLRRADGACCRRASAHARAGPAARWQRACTGRAARSRVRPRWGRPRRAAWGAAWGAGEAAVVVVWRSVPQQRAGAARRRWGAVRRAGARALPRAAAGTRSAAADADVSGSLAARPSPRRRPPGSVAKCGNADCVCELEGLDVHSKEPLLPSGFFLVVRRKVVRGQSQLDLGWSVPTRATVVEESGIDRVLQSTWSENPAAGAHVCCSRAPAGRAHNKRAAGAGRL